MARYTFHLAAFQTCSLQSSNRPGSYAMRSIHLCQTSFLAHICEQIFKLVISQRSVAEPENELALWFWGFCHRASHCGSLFTKYFSRQVTGQRGFPGHAIITEWASSSLSLVLQDDSSLLFHSGWSTYGRQLLFSAASLPVSWPIGFHGTVIFSTESQVTPAMYYMTCYHPNGNRALRERGHGFTVISPTPCFAYQSSPTLSSFRLPKIIQVWSCFFSSKTQITYLQECFYWNIWEKNIKRHDLLQDFMTTNLWPTTLEFDNSCSSNH